MAYRPRTHTTTNVPALAVNYDEERTNLVIVNQSGETMYLGVDGSITYGGVNMGTPIYNDGFYEAHFMNGTDPRLARYVIGNAGGLISVTEECAPSPLTAALQRIADTLAAIPRALLALGGKK